MQNNTKVYANYKLSTWTKNWHTICRAFLSVTDKWPFQEYLPSKAIVSTWTSISWETEQWMYRFLPQWHWQMAFPRPPCQTIILLQRALSPGRLGKWMCKVPSSMSPMNSLLRQSFKYNYHSLSPRISEQWICRAESSLPRNGHFKGIFQVKLFHWLKELCLLEDLNNELALFPSSL